MKTTFLRVAAGFLTGWILPPVLVAVVVGLMFGGGMIQPGETFLDPVFKSLIYAAIIGLPLNLGIMVLLVSPTWFFLHRAGAGAKAFLIAGLVIGGLAGLIPLAGPGLTADALTPLEVALALAIPAVIGALTFLLIRRIAYRRAG